MNPYTSLSLTGGLPPEQNEGSREDIDSTIMDVDIPQDPNKKGRRSKTDDPASRQVQERFKCSTCGESFRHLTNLSRHRRMHKKTLTNVSCTICGKMFARPDSMKRHRKNHLTHSPAPFPSLPENPALNRNELADNPNPTHTPPPDLVPESSLSVSSNSTPRNGSTTTPITKTAPCPACGTIFPSINRMLSHLMNDHIDDYPSSPKPPKQSYELSDEMMDEWEESNLNVEEDDGHQQFTHGSRKLECPVCQKQFTRADNVNRHIRASHGGNVGSAASVLNLPTVHQFIPKQHPPLQEDPLVNPTLPDGDVLDLQPEAIIDTLRKNWGAIRTHHCVQRQIQDVYNFRLIGRAIETVDEVLMALFQRLRCRAKINISFGFVLRHSETGEHRYFHSSQNNGRVFPAPATVASQADMGRLMEQVREVDVLKIGFHRRPDTKWTVAATTNMTVYVNKLRQFPIGSPIEKLPPYVAENDGLWNLVRNKNTGERYDDSLCFFRCLAVLRGNNKNAIEKATRQLAETFRQHTRKKHIHGVTLDELSIAEKLFKVRVRVYMLLPLDDSDEDETIDNMEVDTEQDENVACTQNSKIKAELVRRSHHCYKDKLDLNLWGRHFSFIHDIETYSQSYACSKCCTVFTRSTDLVRHELTCDANVKHRFSGGAYQLPLTVFDKLSELGVEVDDNMKYYPYRATYDFETYFHKLPQTDEDKEKKLRWEAQHDLLSVSVASNIPGHEPPQCFVSDGSPAQLVSGMVDYLHTISQTAYISLMDQFEGVFEELDELLDAMKDNMEERRKYNHTKKVKQQLDEYLKELPVLGFNSGKYDINVIKRYLYPVLQETDPLKFIIKRTSTYMALKTEKLKFLDITNYLAPGYSYSKFLKAYECETTKGFFPYEWVDDLQKLDVGELPPHQDFYSKLKGKNISKEEYEFCQWVWKEQGMTTVREFLIWYNNLDVVPFLEAIEKMFAFYRDRNMDMFKSAISVPGLSLQYLFLTLPKDVFFSLIDEANKDLFYKIKENIVGGPSIIFHRYHEKGKTAIRGGPKPCENIVGFDANALYLWSIMQDMPIGTFIRRNAEREFKPVRSHKFGVMATEWLDWLAFSQGIHVRHQFNSKEKRVGGRMIPVDGYCKETNTVFQFHGCYWHGHPCHLNPNEFNKVRQASRDELRRQTEDTSAYIRQQGYKLIELWECDWREIQTTDHTVRGFLRTIRLPHFKKKTMTQQEVLACVMDGSMFGMVECEIRVPSTLRAHFAEMPPVFKNTNVSREDIGDHMRDYAEREGVMRQPRRTLIGSMFGERILLTTPLLQWYINHGLEVVHIYEVIQYAKSPCFESFGNDVSNARRAGDRDPTKSILADTMKLLGNSAYGKTVTDQERHMNVRVCTDADAPRYVNNSHFRALHSLDDELYECDMTKKVIRFNLPLQIGFFVYQYAKLRMLEFYYDFLLKFIDPSDFQMCEMDTDSAYLAISGENLDDVIKPDMKQQYLEEKHQWFPREDTAEHRSYDKRTPGLFKVEWEGDGIVALCSKTYYCFGTKNKISCKGLNKLGNDITKQRYMDVLESQKAGEGVNRGFRMRRAGMYTYEQTKTAFTYMYPKRKVASDGVTTTYLDL
ncbi:uncharacterized protein [Asterias amurensis]|uniref:uncharacterized protein n=1 Tax=Asterias amurensis TaxID=7602 RepID=UPI003AB2F1BE